MLRRKKLGRNVVVTHRDPIHSLAASATVVACNRTCEHVWVLRKLRCLHSRNRALPGRTPTLSGSFSRDRAQNSFSLYVFLSSPGNLVRGPGLVLLFWTRPHTSSKKDKLRVASLRNGKRSCQKRAGKGYDLGRPCSGFLGSCRRDRRANSSSSEMYEPVGTTHCAKPELGCK